MGVKGKTAGGVYQVGIPRNAPVTEHGTAIPVAMGVGGAINFQPTGKGMAAITGDFVLTATEVNPVLKALHNHMLDDQPRLFFMHYWTNGRLDALLTGLKDALAHVAIQAPR